MLEVYRARICDFFTRSLAYKLYECIGFVGEDRARWDWCLARAFVDAPEHFSHFVESIVRTIDRGIETQAQFNRYYGMHVDAAYFEMTHDPSRWFNHGGYWEAGVLRRYARYTGGRS